MKKSTKLAIAFLALAGTAGSVAVAADRGDAKGPRHGAMRFDKLDADSNGDVSFEEFTAAMDKRIGDADADKDGKMTVAEVAAQIEKMRSERMAKRLVDRFDTDGDGAVTKAEIEAQQKKRFALLDRNDDGKIEKSEMRRGKHGKRGHHNDN
ncbi:MULTISPECIES: EF-hand domain-containing protein [unclassified Mesorhizobium]|uniref:EF-hand domain-containing protein n=1 Tax=unclassified Mesorhizobium TaxID=325217 RepID=UPI0006F24634|nr:MULTISPECIES: EF-hand domain-containing protein [unclassified Mesorhizobium]KQZ12979.1 acid-shock protein [Mesorhizobium sp. Root1471]KQZ35498.1 acid-shock protein [Mesorhizobium sp. Root554]MDR7031743.1 Ca2+-binding EF-hand superfamily protein [Mesorhizobium sp. BE184]